MAAHFARSRYHDFHGDVFFAFFLRLPLGSLFTLPARFASLAGFPLGSRPSQVFRSVRVPRRFSAGFRTSHTSAGFRFSRFPLGSRSSQVFRSVSLPELPPRFSADAILQITLQMYIFVSESQNFQLLKIVLLMPDWCVVLLCSFVAVGFFVVGMSLTLWIKGHPLDSEISTNPHMRRLGIKCAVQQTREADGSAACAPDSPLSGCSGNCSACDIRHD
ncbi:MAG: hypothetical protein NC209_02570 [Alistipes sp.]|nr:hypothetical protein [Alistipes senegalensis]MCM1250012.1 hypothetical protein [Alistipes sp.]